MTRVKNSDAAQPRVTNVKTPNTQRHKIAQRTQTVQTLASLSLTFEIENVNIASTLDTLTQKDSAKETLVFGQFYSTIL